MFDFDRTLTLHDTFAPFLCKARGRSAFLKAAVLSCVEACRVEGATRDAVKAGMVRRLLAGYSVARAKREAASLADGLRWSDEMCACLQDHLSLGHNVLVATGSPEILVRSMLAVRFDGHPRIAVLGTRLGEAAGIFTGTIEGPNCIGARKADRVLPWLSCLSQVGETWGYGNAPWDLPMLSLMDNQVVV